MSGRATRLLTLLALGLVSVDARAYDAAVDATFDAQLYQVASPYGDTALRRRRYTETLTLRLRDLGGAHEAGGPELFAVARLRVDSDLGVEDAERTKNPPDRFVPGLQETNLDLMVAYVEGRNYAHGAVGFRLGRQYVVDALGFWSFDGGEVRLVTPAHLAFEAYGGFEQRGGLYMMSTSRYEADGVYRGDRRGMSPELWPTYLDESKLAPAYGFAVESAGLSWLQTRLTYRKVVNRDAVLVSPFPDPDGTFPTTSGDRVSTERVGWSGVATAPELGSLRGTFVYDAYAAKPSAYSASFDVFVTEDIVLGADLDYFLPTFDGDSIWNWFSHSGTTTAQGRARWNATRRLFLGVTAGARRFDAESDTRAQTDVLGSVDAVYRAGESIVSMRASDEQGDRGHFRGADVSYSRTFDRERYDASSLVSMYGWADPLRPERDSTAVTYVLGAGMRPFRPSRVGIEWEHSMSRLVGHRIRALATLRVTTF